MKNYRFLAATLAFVLFAGLVSPALAQSTGQLAINTAEEISSSSENVFTPQHGNADQSFTGPFLQSGGIQPSFDLAGQTFIPTASNLVGVDVFATGDLGSGGPESVTITIWQDDLGGAGIVLDSVTQIVDATGFGFVSPLTVHFDFSPSVPLTPGNTYALQFQSETIDVTLGASCIDGSEYPNGEAYQFTNPVPECDWGFVTYFEDGEVGGELLPIDSTALVLAGLQSSAIWMLPVLAGAAGVGAFYLKTRMNKD